MGLVAEEFNMGSAKKQALELIQQLPEESSLEDIQYHLYVRFWVRHCRVDNLPPQRHPPLPGRLEKATHPRRGYRC